MHSIRNYLLLIFFLISAYASACDCYIPNLNEKYIQSDFVADITIAKIYPNKKDKHYYRADININKLYKGESVKSIYIEGINSNEINVISSCDIFIPEKTRLIIYSKKSENSKYEIGMCSGYSIIDANKKNKRYLRKVKRELDILNLLFDKNILYTTDVLFKEKGTLHKKLEKFKGIQLKNEYSLFEITFSSNLEINDVNLITGFESDINKQLIEIIKTTEWKSFYNGKKNLVPENEKFLIGLYFYESEKGNLSLISQHFL